MVGSRRTWNTDEPGLGRPKALPSSVPCRVSVIWMVLSGRHMPVNVHWLHTQQLKVLHTLTWPHATSTNPPTLPPCRSSTHLCPPSSPPSLPSISNLVFISHPVLSPHDCVLTVISSRFVPLGHLARCMCYWMCCVFRRVWLFPCVFVSGLALHKIM